MALHLLQLSELSEVSVVEEDFSPPGPLMRGTRDAECKRLTMVVSGFRNTIFSSQSQPGDLWSQWAVVIRECFGWS
jgi:hypothetical protein